MAQIILVGGPTGIGKSRFIDSLIGEGSKFSRPKSYTTRPRRSDDIRYEYEYVSHDEFQRLRANNIFVTVDEIYDNYYAISSSSIADIIRSGRIAIKEIHPKNHAKFKNIFTEVISVLLFPKNLEIFWREIENNRELFSPERLKRLKEDRAYYTCLDAFSYPFDIFLTIGTHSTPELLKNDFFYSVINITPTPTRDLKLIETTNKLGYDLIAQDFSDDKRITTANFHDISLNFFKKQIQQYANPSKNVLDLGTGRGYLVPILQEAFSTVVAVDISKQMLSFINSRASGLVKVIASAFDLPFVDRSFDIVVSSLADPFLRKEALHEVLRILVNGGVFIFSSPSKVWSDAIRKSNGISQIVTKFVHSSGTETTVYSFTYTDDELRHLIVSCGFQIETFKVAYGKELKSYSRSISPALIEAVNSLHIKLDDLPILQLVIARKTV